MARYFLDSSALVKRYHHESGTDTVDKLFDGSGNQIYVSRLALVELHSAFARLVREGVLAAEGFGKVAARLDDETAAGVFAVVALTGNRIAEASALLGTYGLLSPMRTLDAIHLATAQALHGRARITALVAADKKLLTAAAACGLTVLDVG